MVWHSLIVIFLTPWLIHGDSTAALDKHFTANLDTLILTQMISNYGQRPAIFPYVGNPYSNHTYGVIGDPKGDWEGQLTPRGVAQMDALGKYVRRRYGNFIGSVYNPSELFAQSSNSEVSLVSTSVFLDSFYATASDDHKVSDGIQDGEEDQSQSNPKCRVPPKNPAPYHAISHTADNFLANSAHCPAYERLYEEFQKSSVVETMNDQIDDFSAAAARFGQPYQDNKYLVMADLFNTLKVQKNYGLVLPAWAEKAHHSAELSGQLRLISEIYTTELKRLRAGPQITQFVRNYFVNSWSTRSQESDVLLTPAQIVAWRKAKFYFFNANDFSLIQSLYVLGNFNGLVPDYPTAVFFELHRIGEKRIVEIYIKAPNSEIQKLDIPGCGPPCTLEDFRVKVSDVLISDTTW